MPADRFAGVLCLISFLCFGFYAVMKQHCGAPDIIPLLWVLCCHETALWRAGVVLGIVYSPPGTLVPVGGLHTIPKGDIPMRILGYNRFPLLGTKICLVRLSSCRVIVKKNLPVFLDLGQPCLCPWVPWPIIGFLNKMRLPCLFIVSTKILIT